MMKIAFDLTQDFNVLLNNHVLKHVNLGAKDLLGNITNGNENYALPLMNATIKTKRSVDVNHTAPHISNSSPTTKATKLSRIRDG